MKKINVIDFDKTLIPYDSFRKFCFQLLLHGSERINSFTAILLRLVRVYDQDKFKAEIYSSAVKDKYIISSHFDKFVTKLIADIQIQVILLIKEYSDEQTINVLVSASPDIYIRRIASSLNWEYLASNVIDSNFVNMYGDNKITQVTNFYPQSDYLYNFAISDSKSDLNLIKKFQYFKLMESI